MSLAVDALQPSAVRAIFSLGGRKVACNLSDVITETGGAGFLLDFDDAATAINIDFRDPVFLGTKMAGDAYRFGVASFVSIQDIHASLEDASSFAWALIRLYYSAFYAGHSILRLLGQSCSYLDAAHVNRLRQLAAAIGKAPSFPLSSGLYHCVLDANQNGLRLVRARGMVGGAHEAFWGVFDSFLSGATEAVLLGHLPPLDARAVFLKLDAYRAILASAGSGASWLSMMRNEIQYRHAYGVWCPPSVNKSGREILARLARQSMRDPMAVDIEPPPKAPLGRFVVGCAFTIALCKALFIRVAERSSVGASSFARGPLSYCESTGS